MKLWDVTELAKEQMARLTGFSVVSAVGGYKNEEGWHITLDMLEMTRLPKATDVIGTYEVLLDEEATIVKFVKKGTRLRAEAYAEAV